MTTGPISLAASRPLPTLTASAPRAHGLDHRVAPPPTATAAEMAMHRSPADPKAAAARCSAAKSTSASGSTIAWFFAPPSACTRLPFADAALVDVPRYRGRADERDRRPSRVVEQRVDRLLVAVDDGEDAVRQAGLRHSSATRSEADGSRSLGLSTNALPQAIATGCIHIGTITGKLNGVIPATTPSGSRNE